MPKPQHANWYLFPEGPLQFPADEPEHEDINYIPLDLNISQPVDILFKFNNHTKQTLLFCLYSDGHLASFVIDKNYQYASFYENTV